MLYRDCTVIELGDSWPGVQTCLVKVVAAPPGAQQFLPGEQLWAMAYLEMVGQVEKGDKLRIEASAPAKSLGTGSGAMVVANLTRLPLDSLPAHGHIVKARYMPIQPVVQSVDEQDSAEHEILLQRRFLPGTTVVVADLHSALGPVVLGAKARRPQTKIAYIWTDTAALPVPLSRQVSELRKLGLICGVISCGQAVGGDLDAASLPSALITAAHIWQAELVIVIQGPGNLGTGTPYGFSGVEVGAHLDCVSALKGMAVASLRMSHCDPRPRHRGISHHSLTVLRQFTHARVQVPVPHFDLQHPLENPLGERNGSFLQKVEQDIISLEKQHSLHRVNSTPVCEALADSPIKLSTMGRTLAQDPAQFISAAVAGWWSVGNLA